MWNSKQPLAYSRSLSSSIFRRIMRLFSKHRPPMQRHHSFILLISAFGCPPLRALLVLLLNSRPVCLLGQLIQLLLPCAIFVAQLLEIRRWLDVFGEVAWVLAVFCARKNRGIVQPWGFVWNIVILAIRVEVEVCPCCCLTRHSNVPWELGRCNLKDFSRLLMWV